MKTKTIVWKVGRNAKTGELTTVDHARKYKNNHIVETMKRKIKVK